jgi:hypothetical protein
LRALANSSLLSENPAIKYPSAWNFPIEESPMLTELIEDLSTAEIEDLPNSQVKAVVLKHSYLFAKGEAYARNVLYIRHHQETILEKIRSLAFSCLLLGNPGTAKSAFQYYYLLRMVNPFFMNRLPSNMLGQTEVPDLVIRQNVNEVELYDIKNRKGYSMKDMDVRLLKALDPDKALYFYDPGKSLDEPELAHFISIFATMSPNPIRYHEFKKKHPIRLYYPMWSLEELKAVHRHMNTADGVIDPPSDISDDDIAARFREFGGILRHVICSKRALIAAREDRTKHIQEVDFKLVLQDPNIERPSVSHYIMCYKVKTQGADAYEAVDYDFLNGDIFEAVRNRANAVDLRDMLATLIRYEETGALFAEYLAPTYFERFIADGILTGKKWVRYFGKDLEKPKKKSFMVKEKAVGMDLDVTVNTIIDGLPPCFSEMEEGVLYRSTNPKFKAFDMLCKTTHNELLCIQTKSGRTDYFDIMEEKVTDKLHDLKVPKAVKVRFALVVLPKSVKKSRFNLKFPADRNIAIEVWGVNFA